MRHMPADDRLIKVLRAESVSTYMQRVIARLDQERRQRRIAQSLVRHVMDRTHAHSPDGCSACENVQKVLDGKG